MKSSLMMRPQKDGDAVIGPFMEKTTLEAVVSEMGRLAIQVGEQLNLFFPNGSDETMKPRAAFDQFKRCWIREFYPNANA